MHTHYRSWLEERTRDNRQLTKEWLADNHHEILLAEGQNKFNEQGVLLAEGQDVFNKEDILLAQRQSGDRRLLNNLASGTLKGWGNGLRKPTVKVTMGKNSESTMPMRSTEDTALRHLVKISVRFLIG